ncbi:hypothetical protein ADUPG1_000843, partial [Aduncisulcus paluster]
TVHIISYASPKALYTFVITHGLPIQCYTTMYEEEEEEEEIVGEMLAEQDASSSARIASRIYSSLVTSPNLTTSLSSLISIQADAFKHNDSDKKDVESEGNEAKTKQAIQDITDIKYDPLLG